MNTDNDYTIGHDHVICEDYALSGIKDNLAYAIVTDGCSASQSVDIGARILALAAKETLLNSYICGFINDYNDFGKVVITKAAGIFDIFNGLNRSALDATLLVAWVKDGMLTCYMYGDGVFIHKSGTNTRVVHIEFLSGAPAYLSYNLDTTRRKEYDIQAKESKLIIDTIDGSFESKSLRPFDPVVITTPVNAGDIISVCSDGINSFRKSDNEPIKWQDLVEEYAGYKNFTGEFARRRMNAFKRKCAKELTTHSDDISVASIVI